MKTQPRRSMTVLAALGALLAISGGSAWLGAQTPRRESRDLELKLVPVDALRVTDGEVERRDVYEAAVRSPSMRAETEALNPPVVALDFDYQGSTEQSSRLASGELRRQLGLKLRAADSCNVLYVMWRLEPASMLDVSFKSNPGAARPLDCLDRGYEKLVPPTAPAPLPQLVPGEHHVLRAEIAGDRLRVHVDDALVWSAKLPPAALALTGPAGVRTDNVEVDFRLSTGAAVAQKR